MRPFPAGAVGYQVYVRSFADSGGDGVGDLGGVLSRLTYLGDLGVDAVWLSPVQPSPQVDHGYDVSDYTGIDPLFGDLAQFDEIVTQAHRLGIRVLLDLVPNHCSDRHPLFQEALAAAPGSPERAMFHFRPGSGSRGEQPPNNWTSVFGGPAWTRAPDGSGEWYLHLYTPQQPDWNWAEPAVADLFEGVLRFWLDRGVDGFRVDVAHGLVKRAGYPGLAQVVDSMDGLRSNEHVCDLEEVHDVYRRWRVLLAEYTPRRYLIGEVNLAPERSWRYARTDELDQVFTFGLWRLGWDAASWQESLTAAQSVTDLAGAPAAWTLENHDLPRAATRFGSGEVGRRRSLAMTAFLLGLPGSAYLYQGQELALPNAVIPAESRTDPAAPGGLPLGRDAARVPLAWTSHGPSLGFNRTGRTWLPQPGEWADLSVAAQEADPESALSIVRRAVQARRRLADDHPGWSTSTARFELSGEVVIARTDVVSVAITMGESPWRCDERDILFATAPVVDGRVPPDTTVWLAEGATS